MLTKEELSFYNRQLILSEIGVNGQQKLKQAKVLVVGAGGLGCPVLTYLTAAGVGTIGIVDADIVDKSNLHRQVLFGFSQIGRPKVNAAIDRLKDLNPNIDLIGYIERLSPKNALEILSKYDIIVDATDNFPTRYLINDACVILDKPFVLGSIDRFQGQISVMNFTNKNDICGPSYRCLFPTPPKPENAPNCEQNGVMGILPGIIGTMQANEVIKMIVGYGEVLSGKLLILDSAAGTSYSIGVSRNNKMVKLAKSLKNNLKSFDYIDFCHLQNREVKEIDPSLLKLKIAEKENLQIIDIRENGNASQINGAVNIPLSLIKSNFNSIKPDIPVVLFCDYGIKSVSAVNILLEAGYKNVFNLKGGLTAWNSEINKMENENV